jgi:hypothetical protein
MGQMPVAAGMDVMEDPNFPYPLVQAPTDTSSDTAMRASMLPSEDTPDMEDWDQDEDGSNRGALTYEQQVDIGTSVPEHIENPTGSGETAYGTPATAQGTGGGLTQMNPMPYA